MDTGQDATNGHLYGRASIVALYAHTTLTPPEATALVRHRDDIIGRRVLDLGCGAGRLAAYMRPLTHAYVGVDVSPHMVEHCRKNFVGQQFLCADMRDLSSIDGGAFDAVFALSNVVDAVSHHDRQTVLAELHRVLSPKGLLVFSSHNRRCARVPERPRLERSRNPLTQARHLATYVAAVANHLRLQAKAHEERDYAILNDSGHNFAVLHYYIDRDEQTRQLEAAGFDEIEALDEMGAAVAGGDLAIASSSIHYAARPR